MAKTRLEKYADENKNTIALIVMVFEALVLISGITVVYTGIMQIKTMEKQNKLYEDQLNLTKEELKINQDMLNFQYKPQISVEVISPRKSAWFTQGGYEEPNFIQIYDNDFSKSEVSPGVYAQLGDASFPLKIQFYNFGSIGTKIEKIESSNSCNSNKIHSWQMDIMKTRILPPQEMIEYDSYYFFIYFDEKPTNYTFCDLNITYTFFNNFKIDESYKIHYNPFNNSFRDTEVKNYAKWVDERKKERLQAQ